MSEENDYGILLVGIGAMVLLCIFATLANPIACFYIVLAIAYFLITGCLIIDFYLMKMATSIVKGIGKTLLPKTIYGSISAICSMIFYILGTISAFTFIAGLLYMTYRFGVFGIGITVDKLVKTNDDVARLTIQLFSDSWKLITCNFTSFSILSTCFNLISFGDVSHHA